MQKISSFSLIAMLVVSPIMAFAADPTAPSSNLTAANSQAELTYNGSNVVIAGNPYWPGKTITATDRDTPASVAFVKGAYNDALSAANKAAFDAKQLETSLVNFLPLSYADVSLSNINTTGKANVSAKGTVDLTKTDYGTDTVGKALVDLQAKQNQIGVSSGNGAVVTEVALNANKKTIDVTRSYEVTMPVGSDNSTTRAKVWFE